MTTVAGPPAPNDVAKPAAAELIRALNHPIRRSTLRYLLQTSPASSAAIRRAIRRPIGNSLNHHLEILVSTGAATTKKQAGYREKFYSPTDAVRASWFLTVLEITAAED